MEDAPTILPEGMKTCSNPACRKTLTLDQFHKDRSKKDGHNNRCKACREQQRKTYRQTHPQQLRQQDARYRQTHPQQLRHYRRTHAEERRQKYARYRQGHAEEIRQQAAHYRQGHPEIMRAIESRRHARKRGATINDFTAAQWLALKEHYNHQCYYYGKHQQRLTQDHVTPLSKGGPHTASNIVPSCQSCNSKKGVGAPPRPVQPLLFAV